MFHLIFEILAVIIYYDLCSNCSLKTHFMHWNWSVDQ